MRKIWTKTMDTGEFDADFKVNDRKNCGYVSYPFLSSFPTMYPCFFTLIEKNLYFFKGNT
jgi:hypothetical protein